MKKVMNKKECLNAVYRELYSRGLIDSKKSFANAIGYHKSTVSSAMTGSREATPEMFKTIGFKWDFFNKRWLVTGKGEMINNIHEPMEQNNVTAVPDNNYMIIEMKNLENETGRLWVDKDVASLPEERTRLVPRETATGNYLVVRVSGHAMDDGTKRSICEDDELLIKQYMGDSRTMPYRTKLFVLCTMAGSVVKQVVNVDNITGDITCRSFNKSYEDYVVRAEEVIQIFTVEKKVNARIIF